MITFLFFTFYYFCLSSLNSKVALFLSFFPIKFYRFSSCLSLKFYRIFIYFFCQMYHFFILFSPYTHTAINQSTTFTTIYKKLSKNFMRHFHLYSYLLFFIKFFLLPGFSVFFYLFFYDQVEVHETYFAALKIRVEELRPILMKISRRELVVQVRCRERRRMRGINKKKRW